MSMSPDPPDRRQPWRTGFVLLETLVALALAALLLTMLSRSFLSTWHGTLHAREDLQAMLIAHTVLEDALPRGKLATGIVTGTTAGYVWQAETLPASTRAAAVAPQSLPSGLQVEPTPTSNQRWTLYKIVVTVRSPTGRRVVLDAFRLGS
jgi:type II secretory pathway pseudopilin PulG